MPRASASSAWLVRPSASSCWRTRNCWAPRSSGRSARRTRAVTSRPSPARSVDMPKADSRLSTTVVDYHYLDRRHAMRKLEFGLDTFLPITVDQFGAPVPGDQVIRDAVAEAVLADSVGLDSFNIGEHYRAECMDSANHVVLAAIAARTERIRLGTSVTVLSTQ